MFTEPTYSDAELAERRRRARARARASSRELKAAAAYALAAPALGVLLWQLTLIEPSPLLIIACMFACIPAAIALLQTAPAFRAIFTTTEED